MMLSISAVRSDLVTDSAEPLFLHPAEVRQLRLRQSELDEEVTGGAGGAHESAVAELVHVRDILARLDRGTAYVTRRAGLAA